jgi:hypothetical protein
MGERIDGLTALCYAKQAMRSLHWIIVAVTFAACDARPKTPEEALARLESAVAANDAAVFFRLLDQTTREAIASTLRDQRLQRTIIVAKYPESEVPQALARLQAAEETDAARYFARCDAQRHILEPYRKRLALTKGAITIHADGDYLWAARQDGAPLRFHHDKDGAYGFAELESDWLLEQDRATHAVTTVRQNAALFRQAERK